MELTPCIWKKRKLFPTNSFHLAPKSMLVQNNLLRPLIFLGLEAGPKRILNCIFGYLPSLLPPNPNISRSHQIIHTTGTWWNVDSKHCERHRYRPPARTERRWSRGAIMTVCVMWSYTLKEAPEICIYGDSPWSKKNMTHAESFGIFLDSQRFAMKITSSPCDLQCKA